MRLRTNLFALGLFAGLVGLAGCKNTHSQSATTAEAAPACNCASTTTAAATSKNCATCRAPGSAPTVAEIAAASGCASGNCGNAIVPTSYPMSPVVAGDGAIIPVIRDGMLVASLAPPSAVLPTSMVAVPTLPVQAVPSSTPPLGPGIEMVTSGGPPIVLANGDKILPQSTMTVRFGESDGYKTLVGQVSQFRHTWRLRYTAVESDDKLGGSVTLVGADLDQLKEGQMVRVHGSVLPGDDRANGTRYQVTRVEVIEPGR